MNKPLAYSYIRMSTERQLKGDSLRRQMELSREFADKNNLELVENFDLHDIAVSAYQGDNIKTGALGEFLDAVNHGEIPEGSYLLVESFDRLSRQQIDIALTLFFQITKSGINIATLSDGQIYKAHETKFDQLIYSIVVMARAHEESEIKSKRVSAAWETKRANIGNKILTRTRPAWLDVSEDMTKFIPIPERVAAIQRIFSEGATGRGSYSITRGLNNDGIPPFGRSNGWIESYVSKILKNRAVLGEFQPHQKTNGKRIPVGEVIDGYFPCIIDEDTFLKVQVDRHARSVHGGGRKGKFQRNLFTHIVKCAYCGSSMRFIDKGNGAKGGKYFKCSASVRGMGCQPVSWRYADFETSFFHFVREIDLKTIVERSSVRTAESKLRETINIEKKKVEELKTRRENMLNLAVSGAAIKSYLAEKLSDVSSKIESLEVKISTLDEERDSLVLSVVAGAQNVQEQVLSIRNFDQNANLEKRLLVFSKLKEVVKEIRVATIGNEPAFNESIRIVNEGEKDDIEFRDKLIQTLEKNHLSGVLKNPYFTVNFHDGTQRLVIPSPKDPSAMLRTSEIKDGTSIIDYGLTKTATKLGN